MHEANQNDDEGIWARSTAPQTPYTMRQVVIGLIGLAIGLAITTGLPLALT